MAAYTENYNLTLTEREDSFDIQDYNENFEVIDTFMAENETVLNEVNEKLGTSENGETLFSLLKSGGSVIKSIQRVVYSSTTNSTNASLSINPVVPAKCFIIMEHLDSNGYTLDYSLNTSSIEIVHSKSTYDGALKFAFWVIEFN